MDGLDGAKLSILRGIIVGVNRGPESQTGQLNELAESIKEIGCETETFIRHACGLAYIRPPICKDVSLSPNKHSNRRYIMATDCTCQTTNCGYVPIRL